MSDPIRILPALPLLYEDTVRRALMEDLGLAGDLTTDAIVDPGTEGEAVVVARVAGRIAGINAAVAAFRCLDPRASIDVCVADGCDAEAGQAIARIRATARALLSAERTALNFIGHLSGIATATRNVVRAIAPYPTKVVCTRKTLPGLRALEKFAVRAGGGSNHRFGLDDAVLIKDNHRQIAGGIEEAVRRVRLYAGHMVKVEVEVDTLDQLEQALTLGIDAVLLDNMQLEVLAQGVRLCKGKAVSEASGGITPAMAPAVASTGVDIISIGWITHSAPALDVSLDIADQVGQSSAGGRANPRL
jgi:nicotinate-nucleotide pyrophosphorylase (carboxylating)